MITPTQAQINQMIFNRTFRTAIKMQEATDELAWQLENITDLEQLANQLRFNGFLSDFDAIQLAKGLGWTVAEMSDEKFAQYSTPSRFSKAASA